MNHARRTIALLLAALGAVPATPLHAQTSAPAAYSPPAPRHDVAIAQLDWRDSNRDRAVPAKIYFPGNGAGPFPVVIFSHGLGGSRDGYEYLARHWAGCGYVSLHIQHLGSDDSVWKDVPMAEGLTRDQGGRFTGAGAGERREGQGKSHAPNSNRAVGVSRWSWF